MFGDLLKQAGQMQERMQALQEEIQRTEVQGEAGAGLVCVTMNGRHDVLRVTVDPDVLSEEKSLLEDLLAAAVNDAVRRVDTMQQEKMRTLTGGLNLPPGFKLPF